MKPMATHASTVSTPIPTVGQRRSLDRLGICLLPQYGNVEPSSSVAGTGESSFEGETIAWTCPQTHASRVSTRALPSGRATSIGGSPDHGPKPASKERVHPVEQNNTDDAEQQYGKGE